MIGFVLALVAGAIIGVTVAVTADGITDTITQRDVSLGEQRRRRNPQLIM